MLVRPNETPLGIAQGSRQLLAELQARPEQSHLRIGLTQAESLGGLFHGQPLDIPQQEHQPVLFVQFSQRVLQEALDFMLPHQFLRRLPPIRYVSVLTGARPRTVLGSQRARMLWCSERSGASSTSWPLRTGTVRGPSPLGVVILSCRHWPLTNLTFPAQRDETGALN